MFDDIILYVGLEQTAAVVAFARKMGAADLLLVFLKHDKKNREIAAELKVECGLLVKNTKEAQKYAGAYDHLLGLAVRELIEDKKTNLIYGAEDVEGKDKTHHRLGLNQVLGKLLAERGKTYIFDVSLLLRGDAALVLGRMQHNRKVLKKYDVKNIACSMATEWHGVRGKRERELLLEGL